MATTNNKPIITEQKSDLLNLFGRHLGLLTLLAVIFILVIGYLILLPQYQQVQLVGRSDLAASQATQVARQAELTSLEQLVANYQQVNQNDIEKLSQILPGKKDVAGLLVELQTITERNGFTLVSFNINEEPEPSTTKADTSGVKKLTVTLSLVGQDYAGLKALLDDLEYSQRLFDVSAVYFDPAASSYSINIFTYYFNSAD